eukprot:338846-Chlamydomonas_euryale.AAC.1
MGVEFLAAINCMPEGEETPIKDAQFIADQLKPFINEDVVAVFTDNASACKNAGKLLEEDFSHLFWVPCAAHVLDLLLEDICKAAWSAAVVVRAKDLVNFVRLHQWCLGLYRKHAAEGCKLELLRPGETRFATAWIMLERLQHARLDLAAT